MHKHITIGLVVAAALCGSLPVGLTPATAEAAPRRLRRLEFNQYHRAVGKAITRWIVKNRRTARRIVRLAERRSNWDQIGPNHIVAAMLVDKPVVGRALRSWYAFTGKRRDKAHAQLTPLVKARTQAIRQDLIKQGIDPQKLSDHDIGYTAERLVQQLPSIAKAARAHGINLYRLGETDAVKVISNHNRMPDGRVFFKSGALDGIAKNLR